MSAARESGARHGRAARAWIAVQVLGLALLALVGAVLAVDVAGWRPLRVRADLTAVRRNTLDASTVRILAELEEPIEIDAFRDVVPEVYSGVANQVFERLEHFLTLVEGAAGENVAIRRWSLGDAVGARARQAELGYEESQPHVAVTRGQRTKVLYTFGELSRVDWGNPDPERFVPAVLELFTAEDALVRAIAAVSESPRAVFSTGHREPDLADLSRNGLSSARELLERDGFEIATWDSRSEGGIPDDCDVLAIVAPRSALGEKTVEHVRAWVASGGRLLLVLGAPYTDEPGTDYDLAARLGMRPVPGVVCVPVLTVTGQLVEGVPECADIGLGERSISSAHPITASLHAKRQVLRFPRSYSFERGDVPPDATLLDVLSSPEGSWLDLPGRDGFGNFELDQQPMEPYGRFLLAVVEELSASALDGAPDSAGRTARVAAFGSSEAFTNAFLAHNRDLWTNAFNWLVERESRLRVESRDPSESIVEIRRGTGLSTFAWLVAYGLPAACVLMGCLTAWRRRR